MIQFVTLTALIALLANCLELYAIRHSECYVMKREICGGCMTILESLFILGEEVVAKWSFPITPTGLVECYCIN